MIVLIWLAVGILFGLAMFQENEKFNILMTITGGVLGLIGGWLVTLLPGTGTVISMIGAVVFSFAILSILRWLRRA